MKIEIELGDEEYEMLKKCAVYGDAVPITPETLASLMLTGGLRHLSLMGSNMDDIYDHAKDLVNNMESQMTPIERALVKQSYRDTVTEKVGGQ